jgi:hypothetical protein
MAPKEPHSSTERRSETAISFTHSQIVKVQFPVSSIAEPQLSTGN